LVRASAEKEEIDAALATMASDANDQKEAGLIAEEFA
jgi:hypothetical protein